MSGWAGGRALVQGHGGFRLPMQLAPHIRPGSASRLARHELQEAEDAVSNGETLAVLSLYRVGPHSA